MVRWIIGAVVISGIIGMGRCAYVICARDLARAST
jgi:hypothetical protein